MQFILALVNIEFDTEPNLCMYIWVQRSLWQPIERLHPRQHREFEVPANFVSLLVWYNVGGFYPKACLNTLRRRFMEDVKPDICNKDRKHHRGIEHDDLRGTHLWEAAFLRVSGIWHPSFSSG